MFNSLLFAAEGTPPKPPQQPGGLGDLLIPLGLMFVIFYFLLIRPNQKKMKKRNEFLKELKKGDSVITNGGIMGKIVGLTDAFITLEIADNLKIKVLRSHVGFSANDVKEIGETSSKGESK